MGIYVCKRLYICTTSPKHDPIVLSKCIQYHQLRTKNTIAGIILLTMCVATIFYGSYITAAAMVHILPCCGYFKYIGVSTWCTAYYTMPFRSFWIPA